MGCIRIMNLFEFYKKQSIITDPKNFGYLFDVLPHDVSSIKSLLQGLILHFWDGRFYDYPIPLRRLLDIETHYIEKILKKIIELDGSELTRERTLENRIIGSCSDYATLFCSILRHKGIPSRNRVAFSAFYFKEYYHDEVILEYWDNSKKKWCLVDPRVTDVHIERQKLKIDFDLLDVPLDQLILPGRAWKMVRTKLDEANKFCGGNCVKNKGMWYIRDRLIQDFSALNKVEMQLWDLWGLMLEHHAIEQDEQQLKFLDALADLTLNPDQHFDRLLHLYQSDMRVKVPQKIKRVSPISPKKEILLF